jgi:hypothetical protein
MAATAKIKLKDLLLQQKIKGAERRGISAAKKAGKSRVDALRNARTQKHEQLRTDILGIVLTWTDTNPLGESGCSGLPHVVSHNPSQLVRDGVVAAFQDVDYRRWMITQEFTWEVDIELHYALPNSTTKAGRIDPIYFIQRGKMEDSIDNLSAINARIERLIMASRLANDMRPENKNKGVFQKAVYRISCVGL